VRGLRHNTPASFALCKKLLNYSRLYCCHAVLLRRTPSRREIYNQNTAPRNLLSPGGRFFEAIMTSEQKKKVWSLLCRLQIREPLAIFAALCKATNPANMRSLFYGKRVTRDDRPASEGDEACSTGRGVRCVKGGG